MLKFQAYENEGGEELQNEATEARQLERQLEIRRRREQPGWME